MVSDLWPVLEPSPALGDKTQPLTSQLLERDMVTVIRVNEMVS